MSDPDQGLVPSIYTKWRADWNTPKNQAVALVKQAHARIIEAENAIAEQTNKLIQTRQSGESAMERYQHERRLNFVKWNEEERAAERVGEINEIKHQSNATDEYGVLTLKRRDLASATALGTPTDIPDATAWRNGNGWPSAPRNIVGVAPAGAVSRPS